MKFTMPVTFEIDPAEWAEEYGLDETAAAEGDIKNALSLAAKSGGIAEAISSKWPMMRDIATITVGAVKVSPSERTTS